MLTLPMTTGRSKFTLEKREAFVKGFLTSDLNCTEFARSIDIKYAVFYGWVKAYCTKYPTDLLIKNKFRDISQDEIDSYVRQYRNSKLGQRAFARSINIPPATFNRWCLQYDRAHPIEEN
jgi:transposase-like protein